MQATCGTMFMAEIETTTCPSCSEQSHSHQEHGAGGSCAAATNFLPIQTFSKLFDINEIQTAFSKRRELDYRSLGLEVS